MYGSQFKKVWRLESGTQGDRLIIVKERVEEFFEDHVVDLSRYVNFPAWAPDLSPCDFFLWWYLNIKVYVSPQIKIDQLQDGISKHVKRLEESLKMIRHWKQERKFVQE